MSITLTIVRRMFADFYGLASRIYPLHVFALLSLTAFTIASSAVLAATGHEPPFLGSVGDWLNQLFLLNAWIPAEAKWNIPSWSISAEAFAYFLFPLLVTAYVVGSRITQAILFASSLLFYVLIGTSLDIVVGLAPLRCLAGFGLGMLLFYHRDTRPCHSPPYGRGPHWHRDLLALAIPVRDSLIIPAFALYVFATWRDEGVLASFLSRRFIHWLGEISYSVYLMHAPVRAVIWCVWIRLEPRFGLDPALSRTFAPVRNVRNRPRRVCPYAPLHRDTLPEPAEASSTSKTPVRLNVADAP